MRNRRETRCCHSREGGNLPKALKTVAEMPRSFLYMKGEDSPWFALRCSPPSLAGAQSPHPQRPGLPRPPALKNKNPANTGRIFTTNYEDLFHVQRTEESLNAIEISDAYLNVVFLLESRTLVKGFSFIKC